MGPFSCMDGNRISRRPETPATVEPWPLTFLPPLQLIEDLRKQLEHLQLFKLEAEQRRGRSSSLGLQEYNSRTRETELEQEIRRLKQVPGVGACP